MLQRRKDDKRATLIRDKLYIDNVEYKTRPATTTGDGRYHGPEKCDLSIGAWNVEGLSQCIDDPDFLNFVSTFYIFFIS